MEFRPDPFGRRLTVGGPPQPTDPNFVPNEYGTGVVIDRRGLILTASHVLGDENDNYYITTSDRRVYHAWIKAADPRSDLAVLSIDGADAASANMAPIRLGDAATLRKGQIVVTLGNPYAIARDGQASAGWGIVSNLGRKAPPAPDDTEPGGKTTLYHFGGLIQTDARLHLGTSGGPLLNLRGEMIGLCVSPAAMTGYESPAGYAIPVDATFRRVLDILQQGREAEYGFLGVLPVNLKAAEIAAGLQGIRARVVPGTPAGRSGLRDDDIITSVNGARSTTPTAWCWKSAACLSKPWPIWASFATVRGGRSTSCWASIRSAGEKSSLFVPIRGGACGSIMPRPSSKRASRHTSACP